MTVEFRAVNNPTAWRGDKFDLRVACQSRDYGLDFLCYDFSEELFIESNRCEESDLTQIFFKNVPTVLHCVVLMKNVSHGREMEGI